MKKRAVKKMRLDIAHGSFTRSKKVSALQICELCGLSMRLHV